MTILSSVVLVHRLSSGVMCRVSASAALVQQPCRVSRKEPQWVCPFLPLSPSAAEVTAAGMPVHWSSRAQGEKAFPGSAAAGRPSRPLDTPMCLLALPPFSPMEWKNRQRKRESEMCLSYPRPQILFCPLRCVFQSRAARPHHCDTACPTPSGTR